MAVYTVTNVKGGVAKTTTAVHLATYLSRDAPTLLVDGDGAQTARQWKLNGNHDGLPFPVIRPTQLMRYVRDYKHIVIDTEANPSQTELTDLVETSDLLIIPAVPEGPAHVGLVETLERLRALRSRKYRILICKVPPRPKRDGEYLRDQLLKEGHPLFKAQIPLLTAYERAFNAGVPVRDVKDNRYAGIAWRAYEKVGRELV